MISHIRALDYQGLWCMFFCFVWTLNSTRSAKVQENRKNKRDMFYLWFSHWYDTSKYISVEGIKSTDICFVSLYNKINYNISYHHFKIFPGQPVKTPFEILKTIVTFKNPRELFNVFQLLTFSYLLSPVKSPKPTVREVIKQN